MRQTIERWRRIAPDFLGDYYPLLPYDPTEHAWMAWQFNRPDLNQGMVQVFRRAGSDMTSARLKLHDLDLNARYTLTDLDSGATEVHLASELETEGVNVSIPLAESSRIIVYMKKAD